MSFGAKFKQDPNRVSIDRRSGAAPGWRGRRRRRRPRRAEIRLWQVDGDGQAPEDEAAQPQEVVVLHEALGDVVVA